MDEDFYTFTSSDFAAKSGIYVIIFSFLKLLPSNFYGIHAFLCNRCVNVEIDIVKKPSTV